MSEPIGRGGIDYPDFRIPALPHKQRVTIDLAEHAVRIGSQYTFELTGNLLHYSNFSNGFGVWRKTKSSVACNPILNAEYFYKEPYSIQLITDAIENHISRISISYAIPYLTSIGLEFAFLSRTNITTLEAALYYYYEDTVRSGRIKLWGVEDSITYVTASNTTETLADIHGIVGVYTGWNILKLVMDFANTKYSRFLLNEKDYTMKDIPCYSDTGDYLSRLCVMITLQQAWGIAESVFIDNVIVTINEPL